MDSLDATVACGACTFLNKLSCSQCGVCGAALPTTVVVSTKTDEAVAADAMIASQLQHTFDMEAVEKVYDGEPAEAAPKKAKKTLVDGASLVLPLSSGAAGASSYQRKFYSPATSAPTPDALRRIASDLKEAVRSGGQMFVCLPLRRDVTRLNALLFGPEGTPYQGGCFHFEGRFPPNFPWEPPMLLLRTTDGNRCRFNPNLYQDGKVCLSILGTWPGPSWSPVHTISSVFLSVLSLMNAVPYHNEPGFETERTLGDAVKYSEIVQHETMRVAVCGAFEAPTFDAECDGRFFPKMRETFLRNFDGWIQKCEELLKLDGVGMEDPFGATRGTFAFADIMRRMRVIKADIDAGLYTNGRKQ